MIFQIFINIAYALVFTVTAPFRLLPYVTLPSEMTSAITSASGAVNSFDDLFPVHEIIYLFLFFFLVYEIAYFGVKLINWVIRKIPTIS